MPKYTEPATSHHHTTSNAHGHALTSNIARTIDIRDDAEEDVGSFSTLMLPDVLVQGLSDSGFTTPSPIQLHAIPLARCGGGESGHCHSQGLMRELIITIAVLMLSHAINNAHVWTTDVLAQAKAGTGKTCVFAVVALELSKADIPYPQVGTS